MFLNSAEHGAQSLDTLVPPTPPPGTGVSFGIVGHATAEAYTVPEKPACSLSPMALENEDTHPWHQDTSGLAVYFLLEQGL